MKKTRGFTLVELLIAISILVAVTAVLLPNLGKLGAKSRDTTRQADLKKIQTALEQYFIDQNFYPETIGTPGQPILSPGSEKTYLGSIPKDPKTGSGYPYEAKPSGCNNGSANPVVYCASYCLYANLETSSAVEASSGCNTSGYNLAIGPSLGGSEISSSSSTDYSRTTATPRPATPTPTPRPATPTPIPLPTATPIPIATPTPVPNPFPASGLTAYWKMDESGDVVVDHTGGDNGIAAATGTGSGKIGNGRVFNGTNSRITVGNTSGVNITGSMTISAWINPDNADFTYRHVAIKWGDGTRQYFFARDTANKMTVWLSPNGSTNILGIRQSSSTIPANTWTHVAVTFNAGASLDVYINGSVNNGPFSGTMPSSLYNGGAPMYLGPYPDQTWKGMMDEVGIWNRALSASEIATLYNGGAGRQP